MPLHGWRVRSANGEPLSTGRTRLAQDLKVIGMNAPGHTSHRLVVVGGGAAGLEFATGMGDRYGKRGQVHLTLVERSRSHIWKPLLHSVAAGSMDPGTHELDYL